MKRNTNERSERLLSAFGDLDPAMLREADAHTAHRAAPPARYRRLFLSVAAATLCLLLLTVTVFAAVPSLRRMINLPFLRESERQESVPEGWVGVYTAEDLDAIRHDPSGKYILMNDITFTDGDAPFIPIGSAEEPFIGRFDGNGYVIRGLKIQATQALPPVQTCTGFPGLPHSGDKKFTYHDILQTKPVYVGLFGFCGHGGAYPYLRDAKPYQGMISNLGIEDAEILLSDASNAYVGVIAGHASYMAGCYVKNSTVTVRGYACEAEEAYFKLYAGGLAGQVQLMDSCYAIGISITAQKVAALTELFEENMMGALAGNVYTVLTSYAAGCSLKSDHPDTLMGDLYGHVHLLPSIMNESQFLTVYERYYRATHEMTAEEPLPENWLSGGNYSSMHSEADFYCRKFRSYYVEKQLGTLVGDMGFDFENINPALLMGEFSPEYIMYIYDLAAHMDETLTNETALLGQMDMETICEIMTCDNFKIGPLDTYVLDADKTYRESDFAQFDFESIWEMKDGRPALRIFS